MKIGRYGIWKGVLLIVMALVSSCACFDFSLDIGCGMGYYDVDEDDDVSWYDDPADIDGRDDVELLIDERELDEMIDECSAEEVCNGYDDDCNGIVDDVDGEPYCGDGCCNGDEPGTRCGDCLCDEPSTPGLLSPRNGAKMQTQAPEFRWDRASGGCGEPLYHLQVDDSCDVEDMDTCPFDDPEIDEYGIETTSYIPEVELPLNESSPWTRIYFWRVRGCYAEDLCSPWSEPRFFDVDKARGDLNGDGWSDIAVGVENALGEEPQEGKVYVFYMTDTGLDRDPSLVLHNPIRDGGAHFGASVSIGGDLNGDGFSDLVVGAESQDGEEVDEGAVYIYYGGAAGIPTEPSIELRTPSHQSRSKFGISVESSGDFNGDGYSDLAVGAEWMDGEARNEGAVYVYFGSDEGVAGDVHVTMFNPEHQEGGHFGISLAGDGDFNADGFDDLVVGADFQDGVFADQGKAYVYYGSASGLGVEHLEVLGNAPANHNQFGASMSSSGDMNGDGLSDLIVSANMLGDDPETGAFFLYFGQESGLASYGRMYLATPEGELQEHLNITISMIGDVDGDGHDDAAAGAAGNAEAEGTIFIYRGADRPVSAYPDFIFEGAEQGFGYDVLQAGDLNHDGIGDFVVTEAIGERELRAYVYYGLEYCCTLYLE